MLISQELWPSHKIRLNVGLMGGSSARPGVAEMYGIFTDRWRKASHIWFQGHVNTALKRHSNRFLGLPISLFSHHRHRSTCGTRREVACNLPSNTSQMACYHYICVTEKAQCLRDLYRRLHEPTAQCLDAAATATAAVASAADAVTTAGT